MSIEKSTIDVVGAKIAVRRRGRGRPVLALHAIGHDARDFDALSERLGDRFDIHALDWPGHGDSPRDGQPVSGKRFGEIAISAIDALGISSAIVIGNSVGGAAAIRASVGRPDRISGVVLCNSAGLAPISWIANLYCKSMARRFQRGADGAPSFARWYDRYYRKLLTEPAAEARRNEIVANGPHTAQLLAEAWRSFAEPDADLRALVPQIACPVLYAWGKKDSALRWSWSRKAALSAARPHVRLFDAGHSVFLERPAEFDAALTAFAFGQSVE